MLFMRNILAEDISLREHIETHCPLVKDLLEDMHGDTLVSDIPDFINKKIIPLGCAPIKGTEVMTASATRIERFLEEHQDG